jgi:hypothetical protein
LIKILRYLAQDNAGCGTILSIASSLLICEKVSNYKGLYWFQYYKFDSINKSSFKLQRTVVPADQII